KVLRDYTARSGRPMHAPPSWALRPMFWQDNDITSETIRAEVKRLKDAQIPIGAYWIDNPWESHHGDFAPNPTPFPDFDALLADMHAQGVRVMAWSSPFVPANDPYKITGTPADNNDATYVPTRGLETHA